MLVSVAHAMGNAGAPAGTTDQNIFVQFVPLVLMLLIFYVLLIRPQQKRAKQHNAMLAGLKKGDQVLTAGGLIGRITHVEGDVLTIDLGHTEVRVARSFVNSLAETKAETKTKESKTGETESK